MENIAQTKPTANQLTGTIRSFDLEVLAENAIYEIKTLLNVLHKDEIESPRIEQIKTIHSIILEKLSAISTFMDAQNDRHDSNQNGKFNAAKRAIKD